MQDLMKALISFAVLVLAAILYERFKLGAQDDEDARNYRLIRKYLLNDSSIARSGLPILWVHIEYEKNARWWPSFGSRSTDDLNQPYVYLTIKSLIDRCGGDFNICLIDDDTFGKILPGWTVDFDRISDPVKNKMRNLALTRVLYHYGGLTVPASFLCMKNLGPIYKSLTEGGRMVAGELIDRNSTSAYTNFFPSNRILGCQRGCKAMEELMQTLERIISSDYTDESVFLGSEDRHILQAIMDGKCTAIDARLLGAEDERGQAVTLERLIGNTNVPFDRNLIGVYIPACDILNRVAYQWFARLSAAQAMLSNTTIGDLFRSAKI